MKDDPLNDDDLTSLLSEALDSGDERRITLTIALCLLGLDQDDEI